VSTPSEELIVLNQVADIDIKEGPMQISRDNTSRRITIGINVRDRDVESFITEVSKMLDTHFNLPAGYYTTYGGQFENLQAARRSSSIAVPIALAVILILLYFAFYSLKHALMIFTAIPMAAVGGIWALLIRGMPFSISAGVGFIALFGVAVLNGIVLISYYNELKHEGMTDILERVLVGTRTRLRPVLMTASVAALGFAPMALSTAAGAEVQKPLATVVIGGIITATFLTLVVLPLIYVMFDEGFKPGKLFSKKMGMEPLEHKRWSVSIKLIWMLLLSWPWKIISSSKMPVSILKKHTNSKKLLLAYLHRNYTLSWARSTQHFMIATFPSASRLVSRRYTHPLLS
jgi:cobalt-zinc-cadmium resistance protein CzcA